MNLELTDWTVQVDRAAAELAGETIRHDVGGPYVTLALFRGPDAEGRARGVVAEMNAIAGEGYCWAASGADILAERDARARTTN